MRAEPTMLGRAINGNHNRNWHGSINLLPGNIANKTSGGPTNVTKVKHPFGIHSPTFSKLRMTVAMPAKGTTSTHFLDSVEGEISFFHSIMRARPIGMHRYFHILAIRNAIQRDTGAHVHIDTLWGEVAQVLRSRRAGCYRAWAAEFGASSPLLIYALCVGHRGLKGTTHRVRTRRPLSLARRRHLRTSRGTRSSSARKFSLPYEEV